jgi:hypothetical protein
MAVRSVSRTNRALLLRNGCIYVSSPILVTLMMEAPRFSATSVRTRATLRNISEDFISHDYPQFFVFSPVLSNALMRSIHVRRLAQLYEGSWDNTHDLS